MTITEMIKDHKRDKLIISFIPLCKKLARQYNVDVGVAFETLIKSVSTLIKTQQLKKPITYIYYCVKFACIHYASENYIIRIPRTSNVKFKLDRVKKLTKIKKELLVEGKIGIREIKRVI